MTRPTIEEVVQALQEQIDTHDKIIYRNDYVILNPHSKLVSAFLAKEPEQEKDEIITESINKLQSDLELAKSGLSEAKCYCMFISNKFDDICKKLGVE